MRLWSFFIVRNRGPPVNAHASHVPGFAIDCTSRGGRFCRTSSPKHAADPEVARGAWLLTMFTGFTSPGSGSRLVYHFSLE